MDGSFFGSLDLLFCEMLMIEVAKFEPVSIFRCLAYGILKLENCPIQLDNYELFCWMLQDLKNCTVKACGFYKIVFVLRCKWWFWLCGVQVTQIRVRKGITKVSYKLKDDGLVSVAWDQKFTYCANICTQQTCSLSQSVARNGVKRGSMSALTMPRTMLWPAGLISWTFASKTGYQTLIVGAISMIMQLVYPVLKPCTIKLECFDKKFQHAPWLFHRKELHVLLLHCHSAI